MKTPEEIIRWCDMMLNRHPNVEDTNFFNSIKNYMKEQRPQGEWEDYSIDFYKCPECGYLLNKDCPNCYNRVILPKGGAE